MKLSFVLLLLGLVHLPQPLSADYLPLLKDSVKLFNGKLFNKLVENNSGNIVYSPLNLHLMLTQLYMGSEGYSSTATELASLLDIDSNFINDYLLNYKDLISDFSRITYVGKSTINLANKFFIAHEFDIKPPFMTAMSEFFNSEVDKINVTKPKETVEQINSYAKEKTHGLIDKILDEEDINELTKMVLINVIYFNGFWANKFLPIDTKTMTFYTDSNT